MDWADEIAANAKLRGENINAEALRADVKRQLDSNMSRIKKIPSAEKEKLAEDEEKRLIEIKKMKDLEDQTIHVYAQKGINVKTDYYTAKISEVELQFTGEEWSDLLNREGEYLGMCCAEISRIRDILQDACRNDHYVKVDDFQEAVFLAEHHGWEGGEGDPISRMILLWKKVEKDARQRLYTSEVNVEDPAEALEALCEAASVFSWEEMTSRGNTDDEERTFCSHKNKNYALATVQAAVRTLFFKLKELDQGPITGYGLVAQDGKIGNSRTGLAVYKTKKFAQKICDNWNQNEAGKVYSVKKVRVSMEHGAQIL